LTVYPIVLQVCFWWV